MGTLLAFSDIELHMQPIELLNITCASLFAGVINCDPVLHIGIKVVVIRGSVDSRIVISLERIRQSDSEWPGTYEQSRRSEPRRSSQVVPVPSALLLP